SLRLLPKAAAERFRAEAGEGQGVDPPHPVSEPEVPAAAFPATPPASPDPKSKDEPKVVNLDAGKKEGIEEHKAYVAQVTDLCTLAGALDRVGTYVRAGTSLDQVRKDLIERRGTAEIRSQHGVQPQPRKRPEEEWGKITDKLNARLRK